MGAMLKGFFAILFRVLFRVRVEGDLRGMKADRLLVIANHESFLDGLLLGLYLPLDPVFVVHTGVTRSPLFRLVLSLVDYLAPRPRADPEGQGVPPPRDRP